MCGFDSSQTTSNRLDAAAAAERAMRRVAPLWPLERFVAVNPYLGLSDLDITAADERLQQVAGSGLTMPRAFYAQAISEGRISDADLAEALAEAPNHPELPWRLSELRARVLDTPAGGERQAQPSIADLAGELTGRNLPGMVTDRISAWAGAFFDTGQAPWGSPWRDGEPFAAWRAEALLDRAPELAGVPDFRAELARLPESPDAVIELAGRSLSMPEPALEVYFHRLLMSISGWAAFARHRVWEAELGGGEDGSLKALLAIRLSWDLVLLRVFASPALVARWVEASCGYSTPPGPPSGGRALDLVLQSAFEKGWQRHLLAELGRAPQPGVSARKRLQAVFCIDVRSEPYRRALEETDAGIETLGFAGFFGVAFRYRPLGEDAAIPQCPALIAPQVLVEPQAGDADETALHAERRRAGRQARGLWKAFKQAAVSSFAFVEAAGPAYVGKLVSDTLGWTRPVADPATTGLSRAKLERMQPQFSAGAETGLTLEQRIDTAEGALRGMGLIDGFARVVLLAGHGASTVNNPHAAGLGCGACGGQSGDVNARVAASLLNEPAVREGLAARGLEVPADTVFLAGHHDTTTDELTLLDVDAVDGSHADDLAWLRARLDDAAARVRLERAVHLGVEAGAEDELVARSRDWSQVRPEWGLAGCAAFIAAPRHRTRGLDLQGRAFLHSYDWRLDEGFSTLELIMTAPMVVASWISLQYYGSSVDNRVFGAGNKTLHNMVGNIGVLEGSGGDLRAGLPWQSIHDGARHAHEPVRLSVFLEAPREAISDVLSRNPGVRELADNGWLHLFAMDADGAVSHRYAGALEWEATAPDYQVAAA